ncbi:MAG: hypothetical protein CXR30_11140 [Geobacter sp.]|nr:MAG: hypothetical protein CXR30_11140 [Geobacter sp.]
MTLSLQSKEVFAASMGRAVGAVSGFALFWLLVRALPPEQYAQLGLINGLQAFAAIILLGPVYAQTGREVWNWHNDQVLDFHFSGLIIGMSLLYFSGNVVLVIIGAAVGWISPDALIGTLVGAVIYTCWIPLSTIFGTVSVLRERIAFASYLALDGAVKIIIVVVLFYLKVKTAWFYFVCIQIAAFVSAGLAYLGYRHTLAKYGLSLSRLWSFRGTSIPTSLRYIRGSFSLRLTTLFNWLLTTGNRYVLEPLISRSNLGLFLAAWGLGTTVLGAVETFHSAVMIPVLYQHTSGENDTPARRRRENAHYLATLLSVLLPLCCVFWLYADRLASLFLSKQVHLSTNVVRSGILFASFSILVGIFNSFSLVERRLWPSMVAVGCSLAVGLSALGYLTIRFGVEIGSWGLVLGMFIGCLVILGLMHRAVCFSEILNWGATVLLGIVACVATAWGAFLVNGFLTIPGPWSLFAAWSVVAGIWAAYVWLVVRPSVSRYRPRK